MWTLFGLTVLAYVAFSVGFALCWFCKPAIQKLVLGANTLSAKLHAQADAITAAAKKL